MARRAAATPAARGRGQSAGIDAQRIIEVARGLEPEMLTMQAVARALGVDRSAVNYHVKSRESLLELVARDSFERHLAEFEFPVDADWQTGCFEYARALRDALVSTGALVAYIRYDLEGGLAALQQAELLLEKLLDAGFEVDLVARASLMLSHIAMSLARDMIVVAESGEHPQPHIVTLVLEGAPQERFPAFREVMQVGDPDYGDAQLRTSLTIFTLGMEQLLSARPDHGPGSTQPQGDAPEHSLGIAAR
jgi:AcrR family transcriptional regulator